MATIRPVDPTKTTMLRAKFLGEVRKRFKKLKGKINQLIIHEDAFGLKRKPAGSNLHSLFGIETLPVQNTRWAFKSDAEKVNEFQKWLALQIGAEIVGTQADPQDAFWHAYILEGYKKGAGRSFTDFYRKRQSSLSDIAQLGFFNGTKKDFLRQSFGQPVAIEKVKLLAGRVFSDLKGVTDTMSTQISRELVDGLIQGQSPREVARTINKRVDKIGKVRAEAIARTETIRAHAEGQLDSMEKLGVDKVTAAVEWSTARDDKVCPLCQPLQGIVLKIKEARGMLPRHPNCRCAWKPANVGEPKDRQHRTKLSIEKQLKKSAGLEKNPTWTGGDKKLAPVRPKDILEVKTKPKAPKALKKAPKKRVRKPKPKTRASLSIKEQAQYDSLSGSAKNILGMGFEVNESNMGVKSFKIYSDILKKLGKEVPGSVPKVPDLSVLTLSEQTNLKILQLVKKKQGKLKPAFQKDFDDIMKKLGSDVPSVPAPLPVPAPPTAVDKAKQVAAKFLAKKDTTAEILPKMAIEHKIVGQMDMDAFGWGEKLGGGKKKSYGGILFNDEGKILLRKPKDQFDGYAWTFAKGGQEKGDSIVSTAVKEVAEETGHKGQVIGIINEGFESDASESHFFVMTSKGVDLKKMDKETELTKWVSKDEALALINETTNVSGKARDLSILDKAFEEFDHISSGSQNPSVAHALTQGKKLQAAKIKAGIAKKKAAKVLQAEKEALEKLQAQSIVRTKFPDAPPPTAPDLNLPPTWDLAKVKDLSGSTKPELMRERISSSGTPGKKWVMKSTQAGIDPDHLRSESLADELYRTLGLDTPPGGIIESPEGPTKLTEFLPGRELKYWLNGKTAQQKADMFEQIQDGFVADALLANHDVAGMTMDNIFVVDGVPFRIDNGGSMLFRAQGLPKQDFGAKVLELNSMRDPSINTVTAEIFKGLTDDRIHTQIQHIVDRKELFLSKIMDPDLKKIMASRIDDLESRLPAPTSLPGRVSGKLGDYRERAKRRVAEPGILSDTAERVKQSRANGVTISGDRDSIEDMNILAWTEVDSSGQTVTKFQMKVNKKASDKISENLGIGSVVADLDIKDTFYSTFESAAKTIATHADDGAYNVDTMEAFGKALQHITKKLETTFEADEASMLLYYKLAGKKLMEAKNNKTPPTSKMYPWKAPDPLPGAKKKVTPKGARKEQLRYELTKMENGHITRTKDVEFVTGRRLMNPDQYVVDLDDMEVKFFPSTGKAFQDQRIGQALEGQIELTIPGEVSTETLQRGMAQFKSMGVDVSPPTPEYEELVYLHRTVVLNNDHLNDSTYKTIWAKDISDEAKIKKIKTWAEAKYKVSFDKLEKEGTYNPAGAANTSWGDGHRQWNRWDMSRKDIEKDMKGYHLAHHTDYLEEFVEGMLSSGGEFNNTTGRLRKGISLENTGGMSAHRDIETGGASYSYTRITKNEEYRGQVKFKIGLLSRADHVSYESDTYGMPSEFRNRASQAKAHHGSKGWKAHASSSDNEANFKNGISLLDELEEIKTGGGLTRKKILAIFEKHGVTELNDGRKIKDVVK
jgi:SPP1 gp7 family putative phage head morphogenesis protein|tara:strand:- start:4685 stop:9328 length:4644 start_codon:yes stop_codon:yes gene_type:complete